MELKIKIDGNNHPVQAQIIKGTLWVHLNGRTFTVDTASGKKSRRKSGTGGTSDKILAPMPGKVTKILLTEGQSVNKGQAVLVMEAMKMEYTLKSDLDGVIEQISCTVGEQVVLGKSLVKINPS